MFFDSAKKYKTKKTSNGFSVQYIITDWTLDYINGTGPDAGKSTSKNIIFQVEILNGMVFISYGNSDNMHP